MPVLGRMSDQQEDVRHMASRCFATLVTLMPHEVDGLYLACKTLCSSSEAHFLCFTLCSRLAHPKLCIPSWEWRVLPRCLPPWQSRGRGRDSSWSSSWTPTNWRTMPSPSQGRPPEVPKGEKLPLCVHNLAHQVHVKSTFRLEIYFCCTYVLQNTHSCDNSLSASAI